LLDMDPRKEYDLFMQLLLYTNTFVEYVEVIYAPKCCQTAIY